MAFSPHELSEHAIRLVAAWSEGTRAEPRDSYHVASPRHGRLRAHARSRRSRSLRWFNVNDPAPDSYDAAILIEFDADDHVAAAWKLDAHELAAAATSSTTRPGRRILKLRVGGDWTEAAHRVDLAG